MSNGIEERSARQALEEEQERLRKLLALSREELLPVLDDVEDKLSRGGWPNMAWIGNAMLHAADLITLRRTGKITIEEQFERTLRMATTGPNLYPVTAGRNGPVIFVPSEGGEDAFRSVRGDWRVYDPSAFDR